MRQTFLVPSIFVASLSANCLFGQTLKPRPVEPSKPAVNVQPASVALTVPPGTPLKVTLDNELRVRSVGQAIHGKTIEPIYSFDKLVIPTGTEVVGKVSGIDGVSKRTRTLAVMNADLSPEHQIHLELDEARLPDGRTLPIHSIVLPGGTGVLQFVSSGAKQEGTAGDGNAAARNKLAQARAEAKRQLAALKAEIAAPGKLHRLERLALAQSPYRPQYLDSGTALNGVLPEPLEFGTETLTPPMIATLGQLPESGGVVHAWLTTPLNSSTAKQGDTVDARVSQPLIADGHLYLPEGSELRGIVLQARPARRFGRNGQLRIAFHQVVLPSGLEQQIQSTLEGMDVAKGENLLLDSEGGAQVKNSKTRYLKTGIAVMLAASSASPDSDAGRGDTAGPSGANALNGGSGFKLVGMVVGAFARSRALATGMGSYGAARSVYVHFLARGRDVNYPKNMSMVIALAAQEKR